MIALGQFNYIIVVVLMMLGFYILISQGNLVKKVVGLNIFQTSVIIFYVSTAKIVGGTAPILIGMGSHGSDDHGSADAHLEGGADAAAHTPDVAALLGDTIAGAAEAAGHAVAGAGDILYSNPLPHVLMLTAIVVGVATMSLAFALTVRIKEAYGTIEDDEITVMDMES